MSLGARCFLTCLILLPAIMRPVFSAVLVVEPPSDQYIAFNSMETRNYTCTVDTAYTQRWELNGVQYTRSGSLQFTIAGSGIAVTIFYSNDRISTISIANITNGSITLQCVAVPASLIQADKGEDQYMVVSFDEPDAVDNLELVPSKGNLTLNWERPKDVPSAVEILYTVTINNTNTSTSSAENTTSISFSLRSLEEQVLSENAPGICVMFEFSVSGTNDAGLGQSNTIIDTIPISPDVTLISKELIVERVDLQPFSVQISFPPVNPCSVNFPLHNYTIDVGAEVTHVVDANMAVPDQDGRVRLKLNSTVLSGIALDDSYPVTVTPCNAVTCRTSTQVTLNTTDVQSAEVIYFQNHLFLRCSFADNSRARGCAVRLTLADSNEIETYQFLLDNDNEPCFRTDFRLDAATYREEVAIVDIEEDGMLGSGNITIIPMNVTEEMYPEITGCSIVSEMAGGLSSTDAAILGGVLGPVLLIAIVAIIIMIVAIVFVVKRKRTSTELRMKPNGDVECPFPSSIISPQDNNIEDDGGDTELLLKEIKKVCLYENGKITIKLQLIAETLMTDKQDKTNR